MFRQQMLCQGSRYYCCRVWFRIGRFLTAMDSIGLNAILSFFLRFLIGYRVPVPANFTENFLPVTNLLRCKKMAKILVIILFRAARNKSKITPDTLIEEVRIAYRFGTASFDMVHVVFLFSVL